jgi:hypothetical protein
MLPRRSAELSASRASLEGIALDIAPFVIVLHVGCVLWMVSGIVGRGVSFSLAGKAKEVVSAYAHLKNGEVFEKMVVLASPAVLITGFAAAAMRHYKTFGFLQGAQTNWLLSGTLAYVILVPLIPLFLVPRRKRREAAAEDAIKKGTITPELRAVLDDPAIRRFRIFEMVIIAIVVTMMVAKPF